MERGPRQRRNRRFRLGEASLRPWIFHIRADDHYYSVPYRLVKQEVQVRLTATAVEVFHNGLRVASHLRSQHKHRHTTNKQHMPENHRAHAEWTPGRVIRWVGKAGEATAEVAERIIASRAHPEQGFRACMGVKRLGETYGTDRLEAACRRALEIQSPSYKSVKSILENGLDQKPLVTQVPRTRPIQHENCRGADYYQTDQTKGEPTPCSSIPHSTNSAN